MALSRGVYDGKLGDGNGVVISNYQDRTEQRTAEKGGIMTDSISKQVYNPDMEAHIELEPGACPSCGTPFRYLRANVTQWFDFESGERESDSEYVVSYGEDSGAGLFGETFCELPMHIKRTCCGAGLEFYADNNLE